MVLELRRRPEFWALGAIVVGGAVLRFATLAHQSLWYDEALTWQLVTKPFGDMVDGVVDTENTPPLFYAATHLVIQLAGSGEVGMRLVSAVAGTLTIAVAFLAGRELAGDRAGLYAATLVSANAFLIWFSQEARSYALLSLLSAIALVCFLRVIGDRPSGGALAGWTISSVLALATHYFAIFPMVAEAAWMIAVLAGSRRWRPLLIAMTATALGVAAVAPIAISQEASGRAETILVVPLGNRIAQIPKHFLVGYPGPAATALAVIAGLLVVVAAIRLWRLRHRRAVVATAIVATAAVLVPVVAAIVGVDFVNSRNVLPGLVPLLALTAAGLTTFRAPFGVVAVVALASVGVVTTIGINTEPGYQRTNWRGIDAAVGDSPERRLVVVNLFNSWVALKPYRTGIALASLPQRVREVVLVAAAVKAGSGDRAVAPRPKPPRLRGFTLVGRELDSTYTLYRYRASGGAVIRRETLRPVELGPLPAVLTVPPVKGS